MVHMITTANRFYDGMVKERPRVPAVGQPPRECPWDYMRQHEGSGYSLIQPIFIKNPACANGKIYLTIYISVQNRRECLFHGAYYTLVGWDQTYICTWSVLWLYVLWLTMKKNKASDRDRESSLEHWFQRLLFVIGWLGKASLARLCMSRQLTLCRPLMR